MTYLRHYTDSAVRVPSVNIAVPVKIRVFGQGVEMRLIDGSWDPATISALAAILGVAYRRFGIECEHMNHAKTPRSMGSSG
jgi:hypothetical protein